MSDVRRGVLARVDGRERVDFTFNPQTLKVHKTARWNARPRPNHAAAPPPQFVGAQARTVELQVLFDDWVSTSGTVEQQVNRLLGWTCPAAETLNTDRPQPPLVTLNWGGLPDTLRCYVKDVTATFLLFDEQGRPTRATVDLVLEETPPDWRPQNPTSGGEPGTRQRTLVAGDSLGSVAQAEYGDPGLWRALADANGIDDPMRVPPGRSLLVPPRATARRLAAAPGAGRG